MNKIVYFFCILFLLNSTVYGETNYCKILDSLIKNYLKENAKPRNLIFSGYGGEMMSDIQSITLRFFSYEALNVDEARVLYVEMMEEFLRRINCHKKIRPYLHNFPFKKDNIKLTISFINTEGRIIKDGHVAMVSIARGHKLYFAAYDPNTENFYDLCEEPYFVALKTVMEP